MTDAAPDVVIGVDLGTSSLKAVALTALGEVLARTSDPYPTYRPQPGASEQDPATWLTALGRSLTRLSEQVAPSRWQALGLSAMIPTLVLTDDQGAPVGPAITWEDSRAEAEGARLRDQIGPDRLYRLTGQWVDGRYLLPMHLRIASGDPDHRDRARWLLGAKDYLFWCLTGVRMTDPSTATGFGCYGLADAAWADEVTDAAVAIAGAPVPALPAIGPTMHAEPVTGLAAGWLPVPAGLPVVLGAADSVLAAHGLGARHDGDVAYVAGTSTVVLGVSDTLTVDGAHRFLVTPLAEPGHWGLEMDQLATGSALRWLGDIMGVSEAEVVQRAASSTSDAAPVFLPYLAPGEQGALWDPSLTGSITGLTLQHDAADLARALVTGVILESRRSLSLMAEATGTCGDIRVTGSGASSRHFQQELADATGRSVVVSAGHDHSAVGAAMLAGAAVGMAVRAASTEPASRVITPDPSAERAWSDRAAAHDATLAVLRGNP